MTRSMLQITLFVLIVSCLSLAAVHAQDEPEVRKELDAQYKKLAEAHDRRDLKAIVGLKTADFHAIFPDGRVGDSKVMEAYSRPSTLMTRHIIRMIVKKGSRSSNESL